MTGSFAVRRAVPDDAPGIAAVKAAAWPGEASQAASIAAVIRQPGHATLVAVENGRVLGFVDGFLTHALAGVRRWEVDLLAVHPDHRRRGIGRALVTACTDAGRTAGAARARALIQLDNVGSQNTFARCGYQVNEAVCRLFVCTDGGASGPPPPLDAHFIPVVTLNYRGLWIEGKLSAAGFEAARAARARFGLDLVGAAIPLAEAEALRAAQRARFRAVGDYQWWRRAL